jgi:D-3-phosphoglycerate dehydrogenase
MTETIVVLDPLAPSRADRLRALLPPGVVLTHGTDRGDAHLAEIIADADYAISGQVAVSGTVLRAARRLKLLHKWGVGVDKFDLATARDDAADERLGEFAGSGSSLVNGPKQLEAGGVGSGILV